MGISDYHPYSGAGAYNNGLVASGGILPGWQDAQRIAPGGFDPNYYRRGNQSLDETQIAQAIDDVFERGLNSAYNTLSFVGLGGNQFSESSIPSQSNTSFQGSDSFYSGAGFNSFEIAPSTQAVLGYDSTSSYSFGTQFLMNFGSINQPWDSSEYTSIASISSSQSILSTATVQRSSAGVRSAPKYLESVYLNVAKQQLDFYYTDTRLSALRAEANAKYLNAV